ncbi:hypothetical protein OH77DRAFT_684352 [Trametes cingulata]|nr:hypothetical protein OH77DRAFT_684352 [Trametes cingulata]
MHSVDGSLLATRPHTGSPSTVPTRAARSWTGTPIGCPSPTTCKYPNTPAHRYPAHARAPIQRSSLAWMPPPPPSSATVRLQLYPISLARQPIGRFGDKHRQTLHDPDDAHKQRMVLLLHTIIHSPLTISATPYDPDDSPLTTFPLFCCLMHAPIYTSHLPISRIGSWFSRVPRAYLLPIFRVLYGLAARASDLLTIIGRGMSCCMYCYPSLKHAHATRTAI